MAVLMRAGHAAVEAPEQAAPGATTTAAGRRRFAVFCKSFAEDVQRFARMLDSFERHNPTRLPLFVSVPRAERGLFRDRVGSGRAQFFNDEDVLGRRLTQSWETQQLVKLGVHRMDFADAWLWVDSDAYFFRNFSVRDFVREDGSVAMVASRTEHTFDEHWDALECFLRDASAIEALSKDELCVFDGTGPRGIPWYSLLLDALQRPAYVSRIRRSAAFFGRLGPHYGALPGAVWTRASLVSLENELLKPRRLSFERLLQHSPWEAFWVAEWELFRGLPGRYLIHPPLAHLRKDATILRARAERVTEARLAERYIGVQLAARHQTLERLLA